MTQVALYGLKAVVSSAVCGAITSGAAWGTRYISQIPTQDVIPAAMLGAGMTFSTIVLHNVLTRSFTEKVYNYLNSGKGNKITRPEHTELASKTKTIILTFSLGLGFLASSGAAPRVADLVRRNISYKAAALLSLLNILPTAFAITFPQSKPSKQ